MGFKCTRRKDASCRRFRKKKHGTGNRHRLAAQKSGVACLRDGCSSVKATGPEHCRFPTSRTLPLMSHGAARRCECTVKTGQLMQWQVAGDQTAVDLVSRSEPILGSGQSGERRKKGEESE